MKGGGGIPSRESSHGLEGPVVTSSGLGLGLDSNSSSGRKPLSPSDTSIDESVKSAQHAGKEVSYLVYYKQNKPWSGLNIHQNGKILGSMKSAFRGTFDKLC